MAMEPKADLTLPGTVASDSLAGGATPAVSRVHSVHDSVHEDEGRFLPGTLLGSRYRILALLGRGGMGEVYRAMDLTLGQSVALKFLPEEAAHNERLLERFLGEVRIARVVSHPNVCRVYDIGEIEGMPFISMEYVDGEDLASLLTRIGRLPADKAVETARKLCAGLAAAHDRGVIHRDLKPQNIMMNKRGEVVIMDFGLAAIASELSGAEARNGTPAYMSPEQLKGAGVTAKSDLYALGLVLYELFTGKRPFDAKSVQQLLDMQEGAQLTSMTSLAADIDPAVEKTVRRCLEADPANRPANALTVLAALPGGDPLAAALAAGETPSPEMVASAGKVEGMEVRYSVPCLALVVLFLAGTIPVRQAHTAVVHGGLDQTPRGSGSPGTGNRGVVRAHDPARRYSGVAQSSRGHPFIHVSTARATPMGRVAYLGASNSRFLSREPASVERGAGWRSGCPTSAARRSRNVANGVGWKWQAARFLRRTASNRAGSRATGDGGGGFPSGTIGYGRRSLRHRL